jgi:hypothetical protein
MKTIFSSMCAIAALVAVLWVSPVQAVDYPISVTVTLSGVSVNVQGTYAFGTKATSSATVSTVIDVLNDGDAAETYTLSCSNTAAWTAHATTPGANVFVLSAMFNSTAPAVGDFVDANHALTTTPVASSVTKFAGDEDGLAVPAAGTVHLWLKFEAPTSTSSYAQQTITLTLTAEN